MEVQMKREDLFRAKLTSSVFKLLCQDPVVDGLTPEQLAAIHVMKYEMLASINRLYMTVPAEAMDKLLASFLEKLAKDLA
jgi:hypothetical protein